MKRLKYPGIFIGNLPAHTFYDVAKIFAPYLKKNEDE